MVRGRPAGGRKPFDGRREASPTTRRTKVGFEKDIGFIGYFKFPMRIATASDTSAYKAHKVTSILSPLNVEIERSLLSLGRQNWNLAKTLCRWIERAKALGLW
jgi:hypothetical protein